MADRSTKVTLTAQVQGYVDGMAKAAKATRETSSEAEKLAERGQAIEKMGRAMFVAGGTIMTGLGFATKAAIDWDSAWAGVLKTVDGSEAELALVEQGLRDLTGVLPASHTEIAAVAEAAGQLGVQTPNVVAFTRTMIDLGETTNLSAEEAATSLARFMNVMGTSQDKVSNLGSAVVALGNNYATTEGEIVAFAQRLAGAGSVVGMTEGDVLGLSTALSSVGVNAEAGGTAFSKVMINIASAVESGSDELAEFAAVAGMSADAFAAKWRSSPAEALATFITGLSNAEAQGKSTFAVLEQLGVSEQRMRDSLLLSAAASDQFTSAMELGNKAYGENVALTEEAELRYGTTAAKLDIMRNKVVDAAISLGEQLLPALEWVAGGVGDFADMIGGLEGPLEAVVSWGGLLIGTGLLGAGLWMLAVPKIAEYRRALDALELTGTRLHRTMSTLGRVAGGITLAAIVISTISDAAADVTRLNQALEHGAEATETMNAAAEAYSNRGWGALLPEFTMDLDRAADSLDYAIEKSNRGWFYFERWNARALNEGLDALRLLADEVANQELPQLQASLRALADEYQWTDEQQLAFINNSKPLREALEAAALELGLTTEDADLLGLAFGDLGDSALNAATANDVAAEVARSSAEAYQSQANAARAAADELFGLMDALMESNNIAQDAESANARYQQTVADVSDTVKNAIEGVKGYSRSIDANTVEGSKNREMFAGLAADSQRAAEAIYEQEVATLGSTNATRNYIERLQEGRDNLVDQIEALIGNREEAEKLADTIYQMPSQKEIDIMMNTAAASAQFHSFITGLPTSIPLSAYLVGAEQTGHFADGGIVAYANGGVQEFAGGGFPTGIYTGGAPIHKFAEPETGWEAYISGKPSERDRNRQIWIDTGDRLGVFDDIRDALKGITGGGGGTTINYTSVNPVVRDDFEDAWVKAQERPVGT